RVDVGAGHRQPRVAVGEPGHHVRHQRRPAFVLGGGEDGADPLLAAHSLVLRTYSARSLSPRPERQRTSKPSPSSGFSSSQAIAWEDSSAGMIPSSRASSPSAPSAPLSSIEK